MTLEDFRMYSDLLAGISLVFNLSGDKPGPQTQATFERLRARLDTLQELEAANPVIPDSPKAPEIPA